MEPLSKMTLYDLVAMIFPGAIGTIDLILSFDAPISLYSVSNLSLAENSTQIVQIEYNEGFAVLLFVISSYIIGLIINVATGYLFICFRNNRLSISIAQLTVDANNHPSKSSIQQIIRRYNIIILNNFFPFWKWRSGNDITYYRTYYKLLNRKLLGSIPIIEAQIAFLRNSLIPITTLGFLFLFNESINNISMGMACIIGAFLSYLTMIQLQNKVYRLIWENRLYHKLP